MAVARAECWSRSLAPRRITPLLALMLAGQILDLQNRLRLIRFEVGINLRHAQVQRSPSGPEGTGDFCYSDIQNVVCQSF